MARRNEVLYIMYKILVYETQRGLPWNSFCFPCRHWYSTPTQYFFLSRAFIMFAVFCGRNILRRILCASPWTKSRLLFYSFSFSWLGQLAIIFGFLKRKKLRRGLQPFYFILLLPYFISVSVQLSGCLLSRSLQFIGKKPSVCNWPNEIKMIEKIKPARKKHPWDQQQQKDEERCSMWIVSVSNSCYSDSGRLLLSVSFP